MLYHAHCTLTDYQLVPNVVHAAESNIKEAVATIQKLAQVASNHPYYRFNYSWQRQIESSVRINTHTEI